MAEYVNPGASASSMVQSAAKVESKAPPKPKAVLNADAAIVKKDGFFKRAMKFLLGIAEDRITDIVMPAIKSTTNDFLQSAIEDIIYRDDERPRRSNRNNNGLYYSNVSTAKAKRSGQPRQETVSRYNNSVQMLVYKDRNDAFIVYDSLRSAIEEYGNAPVALMYEAAGKPGYIRSSVDADRGWTQIPDESHAIRRTRDGWIIDLPPVVKIV